MLFLAYYFISIFSFITFFFLSKNYKIPILRFSTVIYIVSFIFIILPGYYVSNGDLLDPIYNQGMKIEIYFIYLIYSIIVPLFLFLGNIIGGKYSFEIKERKNIEKNIRYILAAIIIYALTYFFWVPQIPLNYVLMNPERIFEATLLRLDITHQLNLNKNLPFIFRYWRNIIQIIFLIIFVLIVLKRKSKSEKLMDAKIISLFLFLVYCFIFTLEKTPIIYILIAFFMINYLGRSLISKNIIVYLVGTFILLIGMYSLFLGKEYQSSIEGLSNVIDRISRQSASVYLQYDYIVQNGHLWFKGIPLPILGDLLNIELINLSKVVYESLFSVYSNQGGMGTTGGMSLANLYFSFSWLSIIIFSFYVIVLGILDMFIYNSFSKRSTSTINVKLVNKAFYIGVTSFFSMALVGSVFLIFSSTLFFNPSFYFIFFVYFLLLNPKTIVLKKYLN